MFGSILDAMSMESNYEERKVKNYTKGKLVVDTARVTDSAKPYETAVEHPDYNGGDFIVVETYDTKEAAEEGHTRWVMTMTADKLPDELRDVSDSSSADEVDEMNGSKDWRTFPRKKAS